MVPPREGEPGGSRPGRWSGADVTFAEVAPGVQFDIDAAYHAKYDRYGPEIVGTVVGSQAHDVTIRLVPRSTSS